MLDNYLKRKDVLDFIELIKKYPRYNNKKVVEKVSFGKHLDNELALYVFYDALYKYVILVDNVWLFDFYFDQIKKIYKKLDNMDDVIFGIHKTLCRVVCSYLGITDIDDVDNRNKVIKYVYDKYILDGYYIHGFSTVYEKSIENNGFLSNVYQNYYKEMVHVNEIFSKYGINNIFNKDFNSNVSYFTDNFVMGCYYSVNSPGYFYNLLFNDEVYGKKVNRRNYLTRNYRACISGLKKIIKNFKKEDINYIMDVVKKEWILINSVPKKISLLLVKRNYINPPKVKLDDFINVNGSVYEIVDAILSPKNSKIPFNDVLYDNKINIVSLDDYYEVYDNEIVDKRVKKKRFAFIRDLNSLGVASIFIICGSMAISLGILITIIMIVGGM